MYTVMDTKMYGPPTSGPYYGFGGALEAILGGVVGAFSVGSALYGQSLQYKLSKSRLHASERQMAEEKQRWEEEMEMRRRELEATEKLVSGESDPDPMSPGKTPGAIAAVASAGIPTNYLIYGAIGIGGLILLMAVMKKR
jgi:hypothetical protein